MSFSAKRQVPSGPQAAHSGPQPTVTGKAPTQLQLVSSSKLGKFIATTNEFRYQVGYEEVPRLVEPQKSSMEMRKHTRSKVTASTPLRKNAREVEAASAKFDHRMENVHEEPQAWRRVWIVLGQLQFEPENTTLVEPLPHKDDAVPYEQRVPRRNHMHAQWDKVLHALELHEQ